MKRLLLLLFFAGVVLSCAPKNNDFAVKLLEGEKWWGLATDLGNVMPFSSIVEIDMTKQNFNNQTTPLLVSNKGRYIWSDGSFYCKVTPESEIRIVPYRGTPVCVQSSGTTLRDAYLAACKEHFTPSGKLPPEEFFTKPQYNTWIELVYDQNQKDVIGYAEGIVSNGFPTGVLMIDDNWQKYYGNFEFKPDKFPDPKAMMSRLHNLGFKVMLWISPFVSGDSPEFRDLRSKGYLVKNADGSNAAMLDWWNGYSACYDLSNPEAYAYLKSLLTEVQEEFGVDGFKFDAGDPERYQGCNVSVYDGKSYDTEQTMLWAKLGSEFPYNEFRACWRMGGEPLVQRLGDKKYSWEAVSRLVPSMIAAGLLGYSYTCPDMIGGGEFSSFQGINPDEFDQTLIVRSCQIHSMMPMMQFSVAPWRILSKENLEICRKYALWHESLGDYIISQAKYSAVTGEPIVRHMEYSFPGEGFENVNDQYMLGDKYLVAPVSSAENRRSVKLPSGEWVDDLGNVYAGGRTYDVEVPLERLLYFTRK